MRKSNVHSSPLVAGKESEQKVVFHDEIESYAKSVHLFYKGFNDLQNLFFATYKRVSTNVQQ